MTQLTKLSFLEFTSFFLQELCPKPFSKKFHIELFDLPSKYKNIFCAAPRGHGKSHIFARFYLLYTLYTQPGIDVILVSASEEIAKEHFSEIKRQIENNKYLSAVYNEQYNKEDKWAENYIVLKNRSSARAIGAGAKFRGRRPDLIIVDDLESDEEVRSETSRRNLRDWYIRVLLNTLKPNGQLITIGTILGEFSLLFELINSKAWGFAKRVCYRALQDDGSALWPEEWPVDKLLAKKEIDPLAFATEYQNDPVDDSIALIKSEWIQDGMETPSYFKAIIMGVDPAATVKTLSDFSALTIFGVTPGKGAIEGKPAEPCRIYEIESLQNKLHFPDLKHLIWEKFTEYKKKKTPINKIVIEQSQTGIALYQDMFSEHSELQGILEPIGSKGKDKVTRLKSISHLFANGRVYIKSELLRNHLRAFPRVEHDDCIDAAVYALIKILEINLLELTPVKEDKYAHLDKFSAEFWRKSQQHVKEFFEGESYSESAEYAYINELN